MSGVADALPRILGCLPAADAASLAPLRARAEASGALLPGETCVAAVDESWFDTGARGILLTDRRVLRCRRDRATEIVLLADVVRARVRRMWYPGAPGVGRGEVFDRGPVVILRFRFDLAGGARARLRLQDYAARLRPFVEGMLERFPGLEVARTLPGL
jgi:hypothetical protein